ncbi:MAG: hypothetical protein M3Y12_14875 [Bacteroidota bacterium]|nr:hypothetical protein [Bacteroidota bacterium]
MNKRFYSVALLAAALLAGTIQARELFRPARWLAGDTIGLPQLAAPGK